MKKSIKTYLNLMIYILVFVLVMSLCACSQASYTQIKADEVFRIMEEETGYVILDVRTQAEYDEGHIPDAICIPNETIQAAGAEALIPELPDTHQKILIYCRSGNRSKQAAQKLADMGYTQIYEFGGIIDWPGQIIK